METTVKKSSEIVVGDRIIKSKKVWMGEKRGFERHTTTLSVIRVTKNKIQIHASVGTYIDKYDANGNEIKFLIVLE